VVLLAIVSQPLCCARTVPELHPFLRLGLALSEKQIPQVIGNIET
jgi:hypothetical protein